VKKSIVSILSAAMVVGAAGTTFAAANPFADVPTDHWAYDAVSQLAADGVIEGYGDSTFKGNRNITRYEMAQMVAKAMTKNTSGADKALVDKLAAEFAAELNNLGVRVSNLERNSDMVKWNGVLEYKHESRTHETLPALANNQLMLRLEPTAEVNNNWQVKARLDAVLNVIKDDGDASHDNQANLKRIWAQGNYDKLRLRAGKMGMYGEDTIYDVNFSGADLTYGKDWQLTLGAGRIHDIYRDINEYSANAFQAEVFRALSAANVIYVGADYNKNQDKGFFGGLSYHRFVSDIFKDTRLTGVPASDKESVSIWKAQLGYRFDKNSKLQGFYAKDTNVDSFWGNNDTSYNIEFDYKGAKPENKGSWGAWLAYRHLGIWSTPNKTYKAIGIGDRGWNIGANYTLEKNIVATLEFGDMRDIPINNAVATKCRHYFARVEMFF